MKKFLSILLAITLTLGVTACASSETDKTKEQVSLKYYNDASELIPALKIGAVTIGLLPEPAATKLTKISNNYSASLDLQKLYGGDYPQAVIVAKKSVVETDGKFIDSLMTALSEDNGYLENNGAAAVTAINAHLDGLEKSSLVANELTKEVIKNCNIYFKSATEEKAKINEYIAGMISVEESSAKVLSEDFFFAPNQNENPTASYTIVAPDGAPALALAKLMSENNALGRNASYKIVSSKMIQNYVKNTDPSKLGDAVILPITAASKLVGAGKDYQILGVVTHGNLFVMSTEKLDLQGLKGKTVGVIMKGQVPDLTLKYILKKNNIAYKEV